MTYRVQLLDQWITSPTGTIAPRLFYSYPEINGDDVTGQAQVPDAPNVVVLECVVTLEQYNLLLADPDYTEAAILSAEEVIDEQAS